MQALGLLNQDLKQKIPKKWWKWWNSPTQNLQESVPCFVPGFRRGPWLPFPRVFDPQHETVETPSGIFNGEPPLSLKIDEFTFFSKKMKADCMSMARTCKNVRRCFSTIKLWKVLERTSSQLYKSIPVRHTWHARATDFYWLYRRLKVHFWCSHHSASASWANSSSKVGSLLGTTRVVSRDKCYQWEMM